MEFNESEIARQLTLIEFQIFKNIKVKKFLNIPPKYPYSLIFEN